MRRLKAPSYGRRMNRLEQEYPMQTKQFTAAFLLSLLALGACSEASTTEPPSDPEGQFTAEVSGTYTESLSGEASYGRNTSLADLQISMGVDGKNINFLWDAPTEAPGSYTIDGQQLIANYMHEGEIFGADSGELTITEFGSTVEGSFDFTATIGNSEVDVTGTFSATESPG